MGNNLNARVAKVVGSGPNGIVAAIILAQAGFSVTVMESNSFLGGSVRSTQDPSFPGVTHDWGAASFPAAHLSPFFRDLDLRPFGVEWLSSPTPFGHALYDSAGILAFRDIERMKESLGKDAKFWHRLVKSPSLHPRQMGDSFLARESLIQPTGTIVRFGPLAALPASAVVNFFREGSNGKGATLFGAVSNHSQLSLRAVGSAGVGIFLLSAAHSVGWPTVKGGAGNLMGGLITFAKSLGVAFVTNARISHERELIPADIVIWDTHPSTVAKAATHGYSSKVRSRLERWGNSGVGVTKLNFVIQGEVPWSDPDLCKSPTVHLGGNFLQMDSSKAQVATGLEPTHPFLIVSQPGSIDRTRWHGDLQPVSAYMQHTTLSKLGSQVEQRSIQIFEQLERCAPGFASRIRSVVHQPPETLEGENDNLRSGDIFGGANGLLKMLIGPLGFAGHYRVGKSHHYLSSSSTWPGTGVHGMSGRNAALAALRANHNGS